MATALRLLLAVTAVCSTTTGSPLSETVSCHVCGAVGDQFPGQPPPAPCLPNDLPAPRRCPEDYRGCLTVYEGRSLKRTCEQRAFDSCKVVNRVVYCYCSGSLCNSERLEHLRGKLGNDDGDVDGDADTGGRTRPEHGAEAGSGYGYDGRDDFVDAEGSTPESTSTRTRTSTAANDDLSFGTSSEAEKEGSGSGAGQRARCVQLAVSLLAVNLAVALVR